MINRETEIRQYLSSQPRNKIVILRDEVAGLNFLNVGRVVSQRLSRVPDGKLSPQFAFREIDRIFSEHTYRHEALGNVLALQNVGILFEPELKLNVPQIIDTHSQNNVLFLLWHGEITTDFLYFIKKEDGIKISIKGLSHIIL